MMNEYFRIMKQKDWRIIFYSVLSIIIFNSASLIVANAQTISPISITAEEVPGIIMNIATWFYRIVLAVAVFFVLVAAFTYLTGANNPKNIEKAHKQLLYAVIAIVVALISFGIVSLVQSLIKP
jgi:uncharacterized membrane protein YphA (DoxX/SURF4 family)